MRNLFRFVAFVIVLSAGISLLYDYRMKHGDLRILARATPEKYTLASAPSVDPKDVAALESLNRDRRALVGSVVPSVVSIKTSKKIALRRQYGLDPSEFFNRNPRQFRNPNDQALVQNSLGSGVIVSNEGHIITNNHVVDQVDDIEVQLSDGRMKKARLVGADSELDVAVLKIDEAGLKPLKLGDSDGVQAGDFVLAIGNPFGFDETVTDGIISSKGRPNRGDSFGDYLQTNAAINPGNSGGPLINLRGEVVGINTAIISRSGGSQGIGFAIPSNTVKTALESLLKQGRIIHGYLGIQTRRLQDGQNDQNADGVVVDDVVQGSPAAAAQIQKGDVIRKFDGHEVRNFPELRSLVSQVELNKKVELEVVRNGKVVKATTEIKEQPVDYQTARVAPQSQGPGAQVPPPQLPPGADESDQDDSAAAPLGALNVDELTPDVARRLDLPPSVRGVVVTKAEGISAELRAGDVIEEVDQQPVTSVAEYKKLVGSLDPSQTHVLSVCRHRARSFVVLRPR
ncbi:MAG: trypsin-like peptidase domain-containing protein [Chthoniobacterales bacterium]|nr:trypsin-like peptidase domain-containing protein [Chthoniobacterales bacterium]